MKPPANALSTISKSKGWPRRQRHEQKHGQPYGGLAGGLRTGPDQGRSREVSRRSRADGSVVSTAISAKIASTISDRPGLRLLSRTAIASAGPSSPCAVVHDRITEPGAELAAVLENRQQGAKGGRRQRDRHRHLGVHRSTQSNEPHDREGKPHADQVTITRRPPRRSAPSARPPSRPAGTACRARARCSIASSREARPRTLGPVRTPATKSSTTSGSSLRCTSPASSGAIPAHRLIQTVTRSTPCPPFRGPVCRT
jgi:hypothetical protein